MAYMFEFPHTRTYDNDLGWLIRHVLKLEEKLDNFISYNSITYADPIEWNITTQYPANTVVLYDGTAYLSKQPVPAGVAISNTDYWQNIFSFGKLSYNTTIGMIADPDVFVGSLVATLGYYEVDDGGGAWYYIVDAAPESGHYETLVNGLFAILISDCINVKQYGAKGDGVTNDSAIIQAAINDAEEDRNTVYFPSAEYIASGLRITTLLSISGNGATLKAPDSSAPYVVDIAIPWLGSDRSLHGKHPTLEIDVNANGCPVAINGTQSNAFFIVNSKIYGFTQYGIKLSSVSAETYIKDCFVEAHPGGSDSIGILLGEDSKILGAICKDCHISVRTTRGSTQICDLYCWNMYNVAGSIGIYDDNTRGGVLQLENIVFDTIQYGFYKTGGTSILCSNIQQFVSSEFYMQEYGQPVFLYAAGDGNYTFCSFVNIYLAGLDIAVMKLTNQETLTANIYGYWRNYTEAISAVNIHDVNISPVFGTSTENKSKIYINTTARRARIHIEQRGTINNNATFSLPTAGAYIPEGFYPIFYGTTPYNMQGTCLLYSNGSNVLQIKLPQGVASADAIMGDFETILSQF